jgi:RNA polymerase sigma factor (TIGR02999 family)
MPESRPPADVTVDLQRATQGSDSAVDRLFALVYDELRSVADRYLSSERRDHTLQPTALVHEAYLRMVDQDRTDWKGRSHFFAIAARSMRRILVDHARRRNALRRSGQREKLSLDRTEIGALELLRVEAEPDLDVLALDEALTALAKEQPEQAMLVEMRFFAGMPVEDIARVLGVTERTVWRFWSAAKTSLAKSLESTRI